MNVYWLLILLMFFSHIFVFAASDHRTNALAVVEKELLYLTQIIKEESAASKTTDLTLVKFKLKLFMLLEQYILKNGLTEYALELTNVYHRKKMNKSVLDCITWRAIDFDLRFNPGETAWQEVFLLTGSSRDDLTSLKIILSDKIFNCLKRTNSSWQWSGPPYKYAAFEKKARQIAIGGLNLIKTLDNGKSKSDMPVNR